MKQGYLLVTIESKVFQILVYVVNNLSSDLILGIPFLKENKALLDFGEERLHLSKDGEKFSSDLITPASPPCLLSSIHAVPFPMTVRAVGTTAIPPVSSVKIPVKCEAPNFRTTNKFFEPASSLHNSAKIFMPPCNWSNNLISIKNFSLQPLVVRNNAILGQVIFKKNLVHHSDSQLPAKTGPSSEDKPLSNQSGSNTIKLVEANPRIGHAFPNVIKMAEHGDQIRKIHSLRAKPNTVKPVGTLRKVNPTNTNPYAT